MTLTTYISHLIKQRDNYKADKQQFYKLLEAYQLHYTRDADTNKQDIMKTIEYLEGKEILLSMVITQLQFIKEI